MKTRNLLLCIALTAVLVLSACAPTMASPLGAFFSANTVPTATQSADTSSVSATPTVSDTTTSSNGQSPRTIAVSGTGKVFLVPDIAYIYIGVNTQGEKVKDVLNKNNEKAQAVKKALTDMGVDEKDIQTSSFSIYPINQYDQQGQQTGTSYSVDNIMYVAVRDLDKLGQLLDTVVSSGANSINSIQFDVQDKDKALTEARQKAVEDANKQASEFAAAIGGKLGMVLSLSATPVSTPVTMPSAYGMGGGGASASATVPISTGQFLLTVDVTMVYEIQ